MILTLDHWVAAFPRTVGWIIVFPALGMVVYFGGQVLGRSRHTPQRILVDENLNNNGPGVIPSRSVATADS